MRPHIIENDKLQHKSTSTEGVKFVDKAIQIADEIEKVDEIVPQPTQEIKSNMPVVIEEKNDKSPTIDIKISELSIMEEEKVATQLDEKEEEKDQSSCIVEEQQTNKTK